jgi:hypothetical protein
LIAEAIEATVNIEHKIEDVFESARRAFFSPDFGKDSPLSKTERFTQVKTFDALQPAPGLLKK